MTKTLDELKIGEKVTVAKVHGEGSIRRRLFDMGITPGAAIIFKKTAPLGDPIEINVRGYELALRKYDAKFIEVEYELAPVLNVAEVN